MEQPYKLSGSVVTHGAGCSPSGRQLVLPASNAGAVVLPSPACFGSWQVPGSSRSRQEKARKTA